MAIRKSASSGIPFGNTAGRPANPGVGQTYYNGTLGYLEIYTESGWIPATGANDFSLNLTGTNTEIVFTQSYSSGSYSIVSSSNDTTMDVYAYATDGSLAGYTNTKSFSSTQRFVKMVILGGSVGDVVSFSYKTTYPTEESTTTTTAGPYITSVSASSMPNVDDSITITGGNFATNITASFTGTGYSSTAAKSVVRNSVTSLTVTRPDNFPVSGSPYTLTLTNPSVENQPIGSNIHKYTVYAGGGPSWVTTSGSLSTAYSSAAYTYTVQATDPDGGSISYSLASGSLPTGLSLNSSTGEISGTTANGTGSYSFSIRATDLGGNYSDRSFSITQSYAVVTGGTLTSDSTYYYRAFTGNGTFATTGALSTDLLLVAGGGGGGYDVGAGGGAGGLVLKSSYTVPGGSHAVTIGAGGIGSVNSSQDGAVRSGYNSTFGSLLTALKGGGSGSYSAQYAASGGSGGGAISGIGTLYNAGGAGLQPASASGGYGNPGGNGTSTQGPNYAGYAGGGGAGAAGGNGANPWSTAGDTVNGAGGIGLQVSWLTSSSYGDPNFRGWFSGGGGASSDTPGAWGYGGKGGGGDGANRAINNGSANGYYYIDGKPNTGGGGGGGGHTGASGYPGNSGNDGGVGGSGICVVRYTKASVGG